MKNGEFHLTDDAVVIGIAEGKDVEDAFNKLKQESPWIENYKLDRLVAREAGKAVYLRSP